MIEIGPLYQLFLLIFGPLLALPDLNNPMTIGRYDRRIHKVPKRDDQEKKLTLGE